MADRGDTTARGYVRARIRRLFRLAVRRHDLRSDDVDEEVRLHFDLRVEQLVRRGLTEAEARARATEWFAGAGHTLEDAARDLRASATRQETRMALLEWMSDLARDLRLAGRSLRRARAFTAVAVVTLALGIGANTAIFSVVRGVLLKPLPHRDGDRLVYLRHSGEGPATANLSFSVPEVRDLRGGAPSLGGIAEYSPWFHTLQGADDAVRIDVGLVTGNFFEVMGLSPVLGRLTTPNDDGSGVPPVMVLTHEFWMRRYGGDSGIVGRQVRLDGSPVTVIGVVQPAPWFPDRVDALLNMVVSPHHLSAQMVEARQHRMTEVIARLAPGASVEQASTEVAAVYARMQREFREAYDPQTQSRVAVVPFKVALGERARLTLWLLVGTAAFVMLISAANVANLTLMRGVRRERELVVRAALGASRARLRRLLLVENLALTLMGAALGVLIATGGVRLLIALAERYSPRANEIRLDVAALSFTVALSIAIALLLSFAAGLPAEGSFASGISAGVRRISGGLRKQRLQRALVVAQVAVSVVLLAGAGLLTRTTVHLAAVSTGLRTEDVLTIPVPLVNPAQVSPKADVANKSLYERMRREIRALPGVVEVGLGSTMPLQRSSLGFDIKTEGRPVAAGEPLPHADFRAASPEYFRAAGIPLLRGREFSDTDRPGSERVVIINQRLADELFAGRDPIGARIAFSSDILQFTPFSGDWRTIVGVVGNTQDGGMDAEQRGVTFMPFAQELAIFGGLVVRADSNAAALATAATRIVRRLAPGVPIENVLTVSQIKDQSVAPRRLNAALVSSFGILALIIAAVGIAGVLAFSVSTRTSEIGIRMSLGAESSRVQRMILKEGGVLLALGLVLGVGGAFFAARVIRGLLFGVAPHDPATFVVVALTMAAIGVGACWIPAARAARIDPAIAMRS